MMDLTIIGKCGIILVIVFLLGMLHWTHHCTDSLGTTPIESSFPTDFHLANQIVQGNCDSECRRFKSFVAYDWPQKTPRAAIYVLTNKLTNILKLLINVEKTFNSAAKYPYIIFHEVDFTHFRVEIGRYNLPHSRIFYQIVHFQTLPDHIKMEEFNNVTGEHCNNKPIGYRFMSYFNSKLVYTYPILDQLNYALRLDDDSEFLQPITFDVFEFLRDHSLDYCYLTILSDQTDCVFGLWETVEEYAKRRRIEPTFFRSWQKPHIFYNNFELSRLSIWRSREYRDYIDCIDQSKGIFLRRWGDAPVKSLALSLFTPWRKIHQFKDIKYRHQSVFT